MSGREWKPGDVAMVTWEQGRFGGREVGIKTSVGWQIANVGLLHGDVSDARPLVVIDPEADCERLRGLLIDCGWVPDTDADDLGDILREFADPTPPKPDEPTGLGAVVEDDDGERWIRRNVSATPWLHADGNAFAARWDNISARCVLSDGVQP